MNDMNQSIIIKDVYKLNMRKEIADQAEKLINQVEYPVNFWMNAETDKNYAALNPRNRNQFWITIKEGTSQGEIERIVLANLYKQVQLRKRYMLVMPNNNYWENLLKSNNVSAQKRLMELQGKINAFTSSLECEMYLAHYDISTAQIVRENGFIDRKKKLEEYLEIQRKKPRFRWYQEIEIQNLIDYGFYARFEQRYEYHLTKLIKKIKPKSVSDQYLIDIQWVKLLIQKVYDMYTGDNGEDVVKRMREKIIGHFHLEPMLTIEAMDSRHAVKMVNNKRVDIYTFVPEEYPQEQLVLRCFRSVNECLGLFNELMLMDECYPRVSVAVSYDDENNVSSFVSGEKEYYILLYCTFLSRLQKKVNQYIPNEKILTIQKFKGNAYIREKLMKYALFYISLHEYAHIFHGDCDAVHSESVEEREQKEDLANEFANENMRKIIPFQYREISPREYMEHAMEDMVFSEAAKQIAISMRE